MVFLPRQALARKSQVWVLPLRILSERAASVEFLGECAGEPAVDGRARERHALGARAAQELEAVRARAQALDEGPGHPGAKVLAVADVVPCERDVVGVSQEIEARAPVGERFE